MIKTKFVDVKMVGKNIVHYRSLGYIVRMFDIIEVPIEHLTEGSHIKIEVGCDYCGKIINKTYKGLLNERKNSVINKDCCSECIPIKCAESNMKLYGVENPMQRLDVRNKLKNTFIELYGVEFISKSPEIKEKVKNTNLSRYGVSCYFKTDECNEKIKIINDEKRKNYFKNFGYYHPLEQPNIKKKMGKRKLSSVSFQQNNVYEMLKDKYENIYINFPFSSIFLDVVIFFENIKLDIEYDGQYWHNENKDRRRDEYLKSNGWKILRIKSAHLIPDLDILLNKVDYLIKSDHRYDEIILSDWKISANKGEI
jgi:uncharacterized protein CbrC (UPF0167 family)